MTSTSDRIPFAAAIHFTSRAESSY